MTATQPDLWEADDAESVVGLPYGLRARYERDEDARALLWARARPNRWRDVIYERRYKGESATIDAAVKLFDRHNREREKYVARLMEQGRRPG